jgi:hypothetical protein
LNPSFPKVSLLLAMATSLLSDLRLIVTMARMPRNQLRLPLVVDGELLLKLLLVGEILPLLLDSLLLEDWAFSQPLPLSDLLLSTLLPLYLLGALHHPTQLRLQLRLLLPTLGALSQHLLLRLRWLLHGEQRVPVGKSSPTNGIDPRSFSSGLSSATELFESNCCRSFSPAFSSLVFKAIAHLRWGKGACLAERLQGNEGNMLWTWDFMEGAREQGHVYIT